MADRTKYIDGIPVGLTDQDGTDARFSVDVNVTSGSISSSGITQYTEGDVDASITGTAVMWEDAANTLRSVSAAKPMPVSISSDIQLGAVEIKDHDSATRLDVETVTAKNALFDQSEDGAHVAIGATDDVVVAAGAAGTVSAKLRRLTTDTDAIKTAVEAIDNTIYAEDSPHGNEDEGTFVLAVRNDSGSAMSDDGDYSVLMVDANNRLYVNAEALNKDTDEVLVWANTVKDGSGTDYVPLVDNDGHFQVDVDSIGALEQATPTFYNLTMTVADTEYIRALPANTRSLQFQCRTETDARYQFVTGKVATPTAPYSTLKAGDVWYKENMLTSGSLYLASATAGVIIEIETWS